VTTTFLVWAKNPGNDKEAESISKFLKDRVSDKNHPIIDFKGQSGKFHIWGGVTLDDAALADARKNSAIGSVNKEPHMQRSSVLPGRNVTGPPDQADGTMMMPRAAGDWTKQENAQQSLVILSMPK
jgi:hypothetical protein